MMRLKSTSDPLTCVKSCSIKPPFLFFSCWRGVHGWSEWLPAVLPHPDAPDERGGPDHPRRLLLHPVRGQSWRIGLYFFLRLMWNPKASNELIFEL